jgi:hypothetical protein
MQCWTNLWIAHKSSSLRGHHKANRTPQVSGVSVAQTVSSIFRSESR